MNIDAITAVFQKALMSIDDYLEKIETPDTPLGNEIDRVRDAIETLVVELQEVRDGVYLADASVR